jgi:hypothetical protein
LLLNTGFEDVDVFSVVRDRAVLVCRKNSLAISPSVHDYVTSLVFSAPPPALVPAAETIIFNVRATNSGRARWPAVGAPETRGIVRLGAHLLGADDEELNWDSGRAILPRHLAPGETAEIEFLLRAPDKSGDYIIEFDMVAEHVTWFEDFGAGVLRHKFSVA